MKLVWSKSSLPLSVLIRAVTGEPCSHFLVVFESAAKGLVFESNLIGTHPRFWQSDQNKITIVHEKNLSLSAVAEDLIWDRVVQKYDGRPYDYVGALYLGFWKLAKRLFRVELPEKNLWASPERYFCSEIYEIFKDVPGFPDIGITSGMESPEDVWQKLKDWNI